MRSPAQMVRFIQERCAEHFQVPTHDILGGGRQKHVVEARHVAIYLAREHMDLSFPYLADLFNRDHTSIMHGHRKIARLLHSRPDLLSAVQHVERRLETIREVG